MEVTSHLSIMQTNREMGNQRNSLAKFNLTNLDNNCEPKLFGQIKQVSFPFLTILEIRDNRITSI